jgi:hypothetical protein
VQGEGAEADAQVFARAQGERDEARSVPSRRLGLISLWRRLVDSLLSTAIAMAELYAHIGPFSGEQAAILTEAEVVMARGGCQ